MRPVRRDLRSIRREISGVEGNKSFGILVEAKGGGYEIAKIAKIGNRRKWKGLIYGRSKFPGERNLAEKPYQSAKCGLDRLTIAVIAVIGKRGIFEEKAK